MGVNSVAIMIEVEGREGWGWVVVEALLWGVSIVQGFAESIRALSRLQTDKEFTVL